MVKLINPLNHKGVVLEAGAVISLGEEMEKALVKNKNAETYVPETPKKPAKEPNKEPGKEPDKGQGKEGEE